MTATYLTVFLLFAVSRIDGGWIKSKRELEGCQKCTHIGYEVSNVPAANKSAIESEYRKLSTTDNDCVSGTSHIRTCIAPDFPDSLVDRCHLLTIVITAKGVEFFPEAKLVATMVFRSCKRVEPSTENTCQGWEQYDENMRENVVLILMNHVKTPWDSVVLDGGICTEELKSM